jgi:hypothetical protein
MVAFGCRWCGAVGSPGGQCRGRVVCGWLMWWVGEQAEAAQRLAASGQGRRSGRRAGVGSAAAGEKAAVVRQVARAALRAGKVTWGRW